MDEKPRAICSKCGSKVEASFDENEARDYGSIVIYVTCPNCGDLEN